MPVTLAAVLGFDDEGVVPLLDGLVGLEDRVDQVIDGGGAGGYEVGGELAAGAGDGVAAEAGGVGAAEDLPRRGRRRPWIGRRRRAVSSRRGRAVWVAESIFAAALQGVDERGLGWPSGVGGAEGELGVVGGGAPWL